MESSGTKVTARTSDVSRTGCYLDTLNPVPAGTTLRLRLTHDGENFETSVRVVYQVPGMGMGVAFVNVPPQQQAILDRWLASAPGS